MYYGEWFANKWVVGAMLPFGREPEELKDRSTGLAAPNPPLHILAPPHTPQASFLL